MPNAFNNATINNMQGHVRQLYYRRKKIGRLTFTFEEYIKTFVPQEARDTFRDAAPWAYASTRTHRWGLHTISGKLNATLELREDGRNGQTYAPPVPRHIMIQKDAPTELVQRIHNWAELGGDVSREFGRVMKVLELLNASHSRVAIRYFWPTILAICSEGNNTKDIVKDLQDMRMPVRLKPLPPGLLIACRQTAETIASAKLIPADIADDESGEVVIDIVAGQQYEEPFSTYWGL